MSKVMNTIIGWAVETTEGYGIYNPSYRKWTAMSKEQFESINVGNFPFLREVTCRECCKATDVVRYNDTVCFIEKGKLIYLETGKPLQIQPQKGEEVCRYISVHKRYFSYSDLRGCNCVDKRTLETIERIKGMNLDETDSFTKACDALMDMFSSAEYRSYLNLDWCDFYKDMLTFYILFGKYSHDSIEERFPNMYKEILAQVHRAKFGF